MEPVFEVRNLTAGYVRPVVLKVSFSVRAGETVGILGRNGQGKTTLLRGITGDARRFSGEVFVEGLDLCRMSVKKRARYLSVLPQKTRIPEGISVRDILAMGAYPTRRIFDGLGGMQRRAMEEAAEEMGVARFLGEDCSKLSVGQQQMVLLCRMKIQDTPVCLLDEPNAALDFANTQDMFEMLRRWTKQKGKAGVMVLHDPETALRWCDRLLILREGGLVQDLDLSQAGEADIQAALQRLYPRIRVRKNPYRRGYFCDLEAREGFAEQA